MVLQKRLNYGSSGNQVPAMPHVPRSARGKRSIRKKVEDNQTYAFDLLATVAGKLLETENSASLYDTTRTSDPNMTRDTIKQEEVDKQKSFKTEAFDQQSCNWSIPCSEVILERQISNDRKGHLLVPNATALGFDSNFIKSNKTQRDAFARDSIAIDSKGEDGYHVAAAAVKWGSWNNPSSSAESHESEGDGIKTPLKTEKRMSGNLKGRNTPEMYSSEDPMELDTKPPALVSSGSSAEVPFYRNSIPCSSSFPMCEDRMEIALDKDDDENSSGCTHSSILTNKVSQRQQIRDHRIRKLFASKHWKVTPTAFHDDVKIKPLIRGKKMCYTRQRTQRSSFKRRKLFEQYSVTTSGERIYNESLSDLCKNFGMKIEGSDSHATLLANGVSSSTTGQKPSFESANYHVKLSIKSFKVPELFIEIPENATVGSLKRIVMETVTAFLGGGLRVSVLLQGKKVRDDNKTLYQAGISHGDKLDTLGFMLEPNPTQAPALLTKSEDPHFLGIQDVAEPLPRIPHIAPPVVDQGVSCSAPQSALTTCPETDHDSFHSPTDASSPDKIVNSLALVAVPPVNVEALAVVPLQKSRRSEVQRRIRRPFTVAEVEALVQAVEKLGTGRWRDVKLRAFDNVKHRTYVDLKDKWKTLVHTARISPQQRRGEPVPQELLDRVLSAHAYWSQQQARLQMKPPQAEACLLL